LDDHTVEVVQGLLRDWHALGCAARHHPGYHGKWSAVNAALVALRVERLPLGSERRYWGRAAP
jgi:hypothetical protein